MFGSFGSGARARLVWTTAKVAAGVAFLSLLAANWLSHGGLDQGALARIAAARFDEPTMTGTLARAKDVRLDPCAAPKRH